MFKVTKSNGRIRIFIFGIRIFSYRAKNIISSSSNTIDVGKNIKLQHRIIGENNIIKIGNCQRRSKLKILIKGNNNRIEIRNPTSLTDVTINVGNYTGVDNTVFFADDNIACGRSKFLLFQHESKIHIGKDCLFSWGITMRTGELPHLIFDKDTGEYLDKGKGITIGDHVWIGESCFLLKNAIIPSHCIIGSASVVTKDFSKEYTLIAGNPAKVCKENIAWEANVGSLNKESGYYQKLPQKIKKVQ